MFIGHCNRINCCIFNKDSTRLITAGGFEGIYEWDFKGDLNMGDRDIDSAQKYKHI